MSGWTFARRGLAVALGSTCWAQVTQLVSLDSSGVPGNLNSETCAISADGRFVAFRSEASNLVPGDTNGGFDIFVRDRQTGTTERVSVASGGVQGNGLDADDPSVSSNGRYVAFDCNSTNLVAGDTNGWSDIFVHDRQTGTTERVSVATGGAQANSASFKASISDDGRYVAFHSEATNLVPGDSNGFGDVFVHDRQTGTTERASVGTGGVQADGISGPERLEISADGRYVVFDSFATTLVSGDTNARFDVFLRDRQAGTTERVSVDSSGAQGDNHSSSASVSSDGRYVAYMSSATNLVPGDTNLAHDIFVRDRQNATTERVSLISGGAQANNASYSPSISADGRYVAFYAQATNLVAGDTNGADDVFVRDRQTGTTVRASVSSGGEQGLGTSIYPAISANGRWVAFRSGSRLVPAVNGAGIFVRDRLGRPDFTAICDPGVGGVAACPCANPPAGSGRGCDNSAATGGAVLSATGGTYLSSDSLVFATSGERPISLSIVLQGNASIPAGGIYGQGVRCAGGTLKRLYTRQAVGGSITAPNFGMGDPSVSARSSALGDAISAGQSRWYLVYYRDPNVLGGCPASSVFNATQTGVVAWSP